MLDFVAMLDEHDSPDLSISSHKLGFPKMAHTNGDSISRLYDVRLFFFIQHILLIKARLLFFWSLSHFLLCLRGASFWSPLIPC